jgi:hypothetical protein
MEKLKQKRNRIIHAIALSHKYARVKSPTFNPSVFKKTQNKSANNCADERPKPPHNIKAITCNEPYVNARNQKRENQSDNIMSTVNVKDNNDGKSSQ